MWHGEVLLPPLPERRISISGNAIIQKPFLGAKAKAVITESDVKGYLFVKTNLISPYNEILLRLKAVRRKPVTLPVVTLAEAVELNESVKSLQFEWDADGNLKGFADTPEKVLKHWINQFDFHTEDESENRPGLRTPQIGALHAIAAHFSVGREFEPATVVLPTGTGKTETMLATQVYLRLKRTLVLVPSQVLRKQISEKFIGLGMLSDAAVIPRELARPRTAIISTGVKSIADAKKLVAGANVIVALPQSLMASDPGALAFLCEQCTDLVVDEAHHITASTWAQIRDYFEKKRVIQFTATPFRRDDQRINGKIIFNYKLGDAQAAKYYGPINLVTVEEYADQVRRDHSIAKAAIEALRRDRAKKLDHLLMARAYPKERAESIAGIYRELAPDLKPVVVYSGSGRTELNRIALQSLLDRGPDGARIVICVDMLGEGYDLPNLKVAALHDIHKSLAITLQFIGRFTRKGDETRIGEATVVVNVADAEVENKLADLYAEGAEWDKIIKRLSEERIEKEIRLQDVVTGLKEAGDLHTQISLWNLKPPLSAQFFRTKCKEWNPLAFVSVLPKGSEWWHSFNQKENVLVAVVCRTSEVRWGDYENVTDTIYDLIVLKWDKANSVLCLFSSNYNALRSEKMAVSVTDEQTELLSGPSVFNILNNVQLPLVKSLGSSRIGAISFTSYFGPNVTEGLASIEKRQSHLNNLACLGYEDGERVLWGGTQKRGKIWQHKSATISEWMEWTSATWAKVTSTTDDESNVVKDFLRPTRIDKPHHSYPISVQWGEQAQMRFNDRQSIFFGPTEVPVYAIDLRIHSSSQSGIEIEIAADDALNSLYRLEINEALPGGYIHKHVNGPELNFKKGGDEPIPITEYLVKDPFLIRYVDGSFSYNCYHIATHLNPDTFPVEKIETWDWSGIPLNKESMGKQVDQATIQYRAFEHLKDEYDLIFNDDGCGEAADLVCFKDIDDQTIEMCLVHCKGAVGGKVSADIRNFYTVCGQAQKSIVAKHAGLPTLYQDLKRRNDKWVEDKFTRFIKGDQKLLSLFKDKSRRSKLQFSMILVQPGASLSTISDEALRLLATTELYLSKTTQAKFRVVLSPDKKKSD